MTTEGYRRTPTVLFEGAPMSVAPFDRSARSGPDAGRHSGSFAARLREATRREHTEAESSDFVRDLVEGRLTRSGFEALTAQLYFVYDALERATERTRRHRVAGAFAFDELLRVPAIEADLAFLLGADWRARISPLPATRRYVDRIAQVARDWPSGFVAHHYTRYLGDLSGGQALGRIAQRQYGLELDGVRFYRFERVPKPKLFKDRYRRLLDTADWGDAERDRLVDEARLAFQLNGAMFADLDRSLAA